MQPTKHEKSSLFTLSTLMLLLAITPLTACAAGKYTDTQTTTESNLTIAFSLKDGVIVTDRNGRPLERCFPPCTEEVAKQYGKTCPKIDPERICKGLSDATVTDVHTITIIESVKNPYCYTRKIGHVYEQVCY